LEKKRKEIKQANGSTGRILRGRSFPNDQGTTKNIIKSLQLKAAPQGRKEIEKKKRGETAREASDNDNFVARYETYKKGPKSEEKVINPTNGTWQGPLISSKVVGFLKLATQNQQLRKRKSLYQKWSYFPPHVLSRRRLRGLSGKEWESGGEAHM